MIATTIVRVFQLIFAVIALALSITAVRWQVYGKAPASSGYNAFAGAWAVLFSLVGLIAAFVSAVPGLIMAALDGLTFIILLAGGIAYAVQLRGVNCNAGGDASYSNPILYAILNGGDNGSDGNNGPKYGVPIDTDGNTYTYQTGALKSRCNTALADDAFIFLAAIATLAAGILVLIAHRRGGSGRHSAV